MQCTAVTVRGALCSVSACSEVSGEVVEDTRDLKATITHREKQGTRTDSYIKYRIVTEVCVCVHVCVCVCVHVCVHVCVCM